MDNIELLLQTSFSDHREAVQQKVRASGIFEVTGEKETLLDVIMLSVEG